jgi:hypothetical protein
MPEVKCVRLTDLHKTNIHLLCNGKEGNFTDENKGNITFSKV